MGKSDYEGWKRKEIRLQLNLSSLHGLYGAKEKEKAEWLLENDMYDYYGTDTHTTHHVSGTRLPLDQFEIKKRLVPHLERLIAKAH